MIAAALRALGRALGAGHARDHGRHPAGPHGASFSAPVFHPPGSVRLVSPAETAALAAPRASRAAARRGPHAARPHVAAEPPRHADGVRRV
jgi:hypothetical protein